MSTFSPFASASAIVATAWLEFMRRVSPVTPGLPVYNIGSPLFTNAKVTLSNGAVFEIEAQNTSADNKYIQSATLNGKEWNKSWFSHEDLKDGGKLVLVMGSKPNKAWGSGVGDVPPSLEMK